ncbi:MAG: PilZ domain-containing protein [Methylococcales bacterium]|nr:PilZ domain-containing protein [Methylococcales bacterium]
MQEYDEKRDYIRMGIDCNLTYRLADSDIIKTGRCTSLSGAGVSFITDSHYDSGLAMEINILPENSTTAPMAAFIETVRSTPQQDGSFEIAASIKSLK